MSNNRPFSDEQIARDWWRQHSLPESQYWDGLPDDLKKQYTAEALLEFAQTRADAAIRRAEEMEKAVTKLLEARDLSAKASATMRDESIAKNARIADLEARLAKANHNIASLQHERDELYDRLDSKNE